MSYTVDGATGLLKSASVEAYSNALKGLNLEQAKLVLSTKQLSDTQKEQILTEAGLLKTTGDLTTAQLTETSSWEVLGASIKKATAAMLKWLFLTPAGWATLAITAMAGTIVAYNKWGDTLENNRKKLEELKSEAQILFPKQGGCVILGILYFRGIHPCNINHFLGIFFYVVILP